MAVIFSQSLVNISVYKFISFKVGENFIKNCQVSCEIRLWFGGHVAILLLVSMHCLDIKFLPIFIEQDNIVTGN